MSKSPIHQRNAIKHINKNGMLLVFPINNRREPKSLWSEFFPRKKMRWEWDDNGDDSVAEMWYLMKKLSDCRQVVYSKWYQGRATFFSRDLFTALLCLAIRRWEQHPLQLQAARDIMSALEESSPMSTKELKLACDLRGKFHEPTYNRAIKELFTTFRIVGFGEVDDGAFPSLAVGATRLIYEDLVLEAKEMSSEGAQNVIDKYMPMGSLGRKHLLRSHKDRLV